MSTAQHLVPPSISDAAAARSDAATQDLQAVFAAQQATALRWRMSTADQRRERIKRLRTAMLAHRQDFYAAFASDYRKPPAEVEISELLPVMDEMQHALRCLKRWMKPRRVWPTSTMLGTSGRIQYQPRGRVLIIAPWNYPLSLCFGPLVAALAAGNSVIVKPSEMMPAVSALMGRIIAEVFPRDEVALFEGGMDTAQDLLALPFDHIFFTGSPAVGKIVMTAAAQHLSSVTLELGGKSPTIVDETADIALAAETLMWGKFLNNGQTCVAPDYVYVHAAVKERFVAACRDVLQARYGREEQRQRNPDLTRIVNARHTSRVAGLLADARARGARVLAGGEVDEADCYIAPTLLDGIPDGAAILAEEIFGPLLPIIAYTEIDAVIAAINAAPKPLALYIWSRDRQRIAALLARTSSGGACVNHCVAHFAHGKLPFGGVNNSGIGNAHGEFGFKAFSHERAVLRGSPLMLVKLFFPPYSKRRLSLVRMVVDLMKLPLP